jgi:uncharacterized protein
MQYDEEGTEPPEGFDWDPAKEAINRGKHEIQFRRATRVFFDSAHIDEDTSRPEHGEQRRKAIGSVQGDLMTVIYTVRDGKRRIISARKVRPDERRKYHQGQRLS